MTGIDQRIVFGASADDDGAATVVVGIPAEAWEYMRLGKTHHFDLTRAGLPLRFILFGAENHDAAKAAIDAHNARRGLPAEDRRRDDFSIKPSEGEGSR